MPDVESRIVVARRGSGWDGTQTAPLLVKPKCSILYWVLVVWDSGVQMIESLKPFHSPPEALTRMERRFCLTTRPQSCWFLLIVSKLKCCQISCARRPHKYLIELHRICNRRELCRSSKLLLRLHCNPYQDASP